MTRLVAVQPVAGHVRVMSLHTRPIDLLEPAGMESTTGTLPVAPACPRSHCEGAGMTAGLRATPPS